jgi:methylthioribose-1-phosphate isomerase
MPPWPTAAASRSSPAAEVTELGGTRLAPPGTRVFAPAFDVTPAPLITGIVTEAGIISPAGETSVLAVLGEAAPRAR